MVVQDSLANTSELRSGIRKYVCDQAGPPAGISPCTSCFFILGTDQNFSGAVETLFLSHEIIKGGMFVRANIQNGDHGYQKTSLSSRKTSVHARNVSEIQFRSQVCHDCVYPTVLLFYLLSQARKGLCHCSNKESSLDRDNRV